MAYHLCAVTQQLSFDTLLPLVVLLFRRFLVWERCFVTIPQIPTFPLLPIPDYRWRIVPLGTSIFRLCLSTAGCSLVNSLSHCFFHAASPYWTSQLLLTFDLFKELSLRLLSASCSCSLLVRCSYVVASASPAVLPPKQLAF